MKRQKTFAKRIGIKSTVAYGQGKYAITTFGKGAKAEVAVRSADPPEETLPTESDATLSIHAKFAKAGRDGRKLVDGDVDETRIHTSRSEYESLISNPAESPREDYLGLKGTLERKFFGDKYPKDNLRIQIIYSILDIQKILGLYVEDILHFVDGLQDEPEDLVGLGFGGEKMQKLLSKALPYMGFFGSTEVFKVTKKREERAAADAHNEKVFRVLGAIRQKLAHFKWKESLAIFGANANMPTRFFQGATGGRQLWNDVIAPLWKKRIERVRKSFLSNSAKNLWVLYQVFKDDTDEKKKARARQYYHFSVLKEGKNLGFNLTKTRERFLDKFFPIFHSSAPDVKRKVDTFRSKLYAILDFIIYEASVGVANTGQMGKVAPWKGAIDNALVKLREAPDEEAKEKIYNELAESIENDSLFLRLKSACDKFGAEQNRPVFPNELRNNRDIRNVRSEWLEATQDADAAAFVQLIAFLCNFLEGKEINELVTALVKKFEGIQALIDLLRNLEGVDSIRFENEFALFNDDKGNMAGRIARQLRLLASVGKMKPDMTDAKRVLYKSALEILGAPPDEVTDEWLAENILLDKSNNDYQKAKKTVNPFRNYIAKNVITSRSFYYLVRYAKPTAVRKLMSNPKIVRYVLKRLPEKQVASYYSAIWTQSESNSNETVKLIEMIDRLTTEIAGFSFAVLKDKKDSIVSASRESRTVNLEVERLKKLTTLYMSIAYIAVKSLVKVNARYFIAYSALERDLYLFNEKYGEEFRLHFIPFELNGKTCQFEYLAILKFYLARDEETLKRKCEICEEIKVGCEKHKKNANPPYEYDQEWIDKKKALNSERKACEKRLHFSTHWAQYATKRDENMAKHPQKWYDILASHYEGLLALQATGWLATQARNDAEHLNPVNEFDVYIEDLRRYPEGTPKNKDYHIGSYFEIYHYIRQRAYLEEVLANRKEYRDSGSFTDEQLDKLQKILDDIKARGSYDKNLLKLEYLPFAYNLPRYKNLTTEALFDDDSVSGKKRVAEWREREKTREAEREQRRQR